MACHCEATDPRLEDGSCQTWTRTRFVALHSKITPHCMPSDTIRHNVAVSTCPLSALVPLQQMWQKVIVWLYIMGPYCNLHLKDSTPISSHDVQFMMLYQHTKFGCKRFSHSDDILQTHTDILNLCCQLKFTRSHPVFSQDSSSQWCIITVAKGYVFLEEIVETVLTWTYGPSLRP